MVASSLQLLFFCCYVSLTLSKIGTCRPKALTHCGEIDEQYSQKKMEADCNRQDYCKFTRVQKKVKCVQKDTNVNLPQNLRYKEDKHQKCETHKLHHRCTGNKHPKKQVAHYECEWVIPPNYTQQINDQIQTRNGWNLPLFNSFTNNNQRNAFRERYESYDKYHNLRLESSIDEAKINEYQQYITNAMQQLHLNNETQLNMDMTFATSVQTKHDPIAAVTNPKIEDGIFEDHRTEVVDKTKYPYRSMGLFAYATPYGNWKECTATSIHPKILITAAHCVAVGGTATHISGNNPKYKNFDGAEYFNFFLDPNDAWYYPNRFEGVSNKRNCPDNPLCPFNEPNTFQPKVDSVKKVIKFYVPHAYFTGQDNRKFDYALVELEHAIEMKQGEFQPAAFGTYVASIGPLETAGYASDLKKWKMYTSPVTPTINTYTLSDTHYIGPSQSGSSAFGWSAQVTNFKGTPITGTYVTFGLAQGDYKKHTYFCRITPLRFKIIYTLLQTKAIHSNNANEEYTNKYNNEYDERNQNISNYGNHYNNNIIILSFVMLLVLFILICGVFGMMVGAVAGYVMMKD